MKSSTASQNTPHKKERLQIEVQPSLLTELDNYVIESDLGTRRELFNNMVALWRWAVQVNRKGHVVAAVDLEDFSYNVLTLPALEAVKSQPPKGHLRSPVLRPAKARKEQEELLTAH